MAKCDLCGEHCYGPDTVQLLDQYRPNPDVEDLCSKCAAWANKQKSQLISEIPPTMRVKIAERMAEFGQQRKQSAIRRLVSLLRRRR